MPQNRLLPISSNNPAQPCTTFGIHENLPVLKGLYDEGKANFIANAGLLAQPVDRSTYRSELWKSNLFSHNGMTRETWKSDLADLYVGTGKFLCDAKMISSIHGIVSSTRSALLFQGVAGRIADVLTQSGIRADTFSIDGRSVVLTGEAGQGPSQSILTNTGVSPFNEDPSIANMDEVMKSLNGGTTAESGFFAETWSSKFVEVRV